MAQSRSPDSSLSISSLLASCSLGSSKGSSRFAPSTSAVVYKDRLYESASDALETYIQDYEESLQSSIPGTQHTAALGFANKKGGRVQRRTGRPGVSQRVGRDLATERLPKVHPKPSSRRWYGARAPDLLSLTTDDLLAFPSDGSLPFSERKSHRTFREDGAPSPRQAPALTSPLTPVLNARTHPFTHSFHSEDLRDVKHLYRERKRRPLRETHPENLPTYHNNPDPPDLPREPALSKPYPRWLTSGKSELGVSGVTSIPHVRYPLWIKDYGLLGESHKPPMNSTRDSLPCRADEDQVGEPMVNPVGQALPADLRMAGRLHTPPKDRARPKSNAFRSSRFPRPAENNRSPQTEDVLEAERSWEQVPYSL